MYFGQMIQFQKRIYILIIFCLVLNNQSYAKSNISYYQNTVFREEIKSVQMFREGFELSNPEYVLGGEAKLIFKFDDLSEEAKNYSYTVIHCDANWNESYIHQGEYLNGMTEFQLTDYAISNNTTVRYVNYMIQIPNEECNPTLSGNYALLVFEDNDKSNLVLIYRFYIVEPLVRIESLVKKATFDAVNGTYQEVDFKVINDNLRLTNPTEEIKVVLMQNRRWYNSIRNLKPGHIRDNVLEYDFNKENVFYGGNEFRFFDIRTNRHINNTFLPEHYPDILWFHCLLFKTLDGCKNINFKWKS